MRGRGFSRHYLWLRVRAPRVTADTAASLHPRYSARFALGSALCAAQPVGSASGVLSRVPPPPGHQTNPFSCASDWMP